MADTNTDNQAAKRKPGRSKLVYDKATRTIVVAPTASGIAEAKRRKQLVRILHDLRLAHGMPLKPGYTRMETRFETLHACDAGGEPEESHVITPDDLSMLVRGLESLS